MPKTVRKLRITARREGWRRCGMRHGAEPTNHEMDAFDEDQLQALRADPNLMVDEVEVDAETGEPVGAAPASKPEPAPDPRISAIAGALGVDPKAGVTVFVDAIGDAAEAAEALNEKNAALDVTVAAVAMALGVPKTAETQAFVDAIMSDADKTDRLGRQIDAIAEALGIDADGEAAAFVAAIELLKAGDGKSGSGGGGKPAARGGKKTK